jgi:hypothetical protein
VRIHGLLESLTTCVLDSIVSNMKAVQLVRTRITYAASAFAELVLWRVSQPVAGSRHRFRYRLVYVAGGVCVIRYDNESGKGDHRHVAGRETPYAFTTPDQLITDFQRDIARWNRENRNP